MNLLKRTKVLDVPNKSPNKNYESDIRSTMQYTRWLLELLGLWPMISKKSSRSAKHLTKILMALCTVAPAFVFVPTTLHALTREKNLIVVLTLIGAVGFFFANFFKYGFFVLRCGTIKLCVEHVESDWMSIESEGDRAIMMRNARTGHDLTVVCGVFMYTTGAFYHAIMPLCSGTIVNELNETVRPLVYPGFDIFVDSQASPTYEIIFCTICFSAFVAFNVTTAACSLAAVLVSHACGQIQIVVSRLESLVDGGSDGRDSATGLQDRLSFVIRCHVRVLRLSSRIEEVLREICLVEVVASTLVICVNEFCFLAMLNNNEIVGMVTYLVAVLSLSFNIFIFCHIGELLKEQCQQVEKAAYMIDWYRLPGKTGLALIMIIVMSNNPRKITAGGLFELSIRTFGEIIKTTVMYLNLMRAIEG